MKRYLVQQLALLFTMVALFNSLIPVYAADTDIPVNDPIIEEYTSIGSTSASISISGSTATCSGLLTSKYACYLCVKLELQKYSGGSYTTVKTWSATKQNGSSLSNSGSATINKSYRYRLKATFTAHGENAVIYRYP